MSFFLSFKAQLIAQTVGHAFQLAYLDFLRENGIEDLGIIKQLDYDDILKQQEIFCDELSLFCDKDNHKEVCFFSFHFCLVSGLTRLSIDYSSIQPVCVLIILVVIIIIVLLLSSQIDWNQIILT